MEQAKKITGEVEITQLKIEGVPNFKKKIKNSLKKSTSELLEIILAGSINLDASDIHIEPEEEQAKLRIRIDGLLQDVLFFDLKTHQSLVSRIKLLSELKLNVSDRPQDGRFSILLEK
ncbi:MAG: hypothetical protein COT32_01175, partial [Candidatus Nealsonbacteria bacterium CG08_land_8_20_14_0_20_36_22]